jgi:aminopeptidase S
VPARPRRPSGGRRSSPVRQVFTYWDKDSDTEVETFNILADTEGSAQHVVVVGSHQDSVSGGPGINDNASGVAAVLETAGEAGPDGSADIERLFLDCFSENSLAAEATQFDRGSDYAPFPEAGIPAGGLFAGDVGTKTTEQVRSYGGLAGEDHEALILVGNFERLTAATETPRTALGRR